MAQSPLSAPPFLRIFIAWWIIWAGLQTIVLYWMEQEWQIAAIDSIVFTLMTASACLLLCYVMQFYLPRQERYWYILFASVLLTAIVVFISRSILEGIFDYQPVYKTFLKNSMLLRWAFVFLLIVCMSMISVLWYSFQEVRESEKRKTDTETLNKEAELVVLRRQLQPHFLFNSLNSISALTAARPVEARLMIQRLADFLRGTINKDDTQIVTLAEELEQVRLYLSIEEVRFGDRLLTEIVCGPDCGAMKIPALILQPIVENAIKFGLYDTVGKVTIFIQAYIENGILLITVTNPVDPDSSAQRKGTGFGLSSVQRRLYLIFARNDLMVLTSERGFFTITIKIPQLA